MHKIKANNIKSIRLDICTICNFKCPGCPTQTYQNENLGRGYLSCKDFEKIITANKNLKQIEIAYAGEAFLNPEIKEILKTAKSHNIALTLNHGSTLNNVDEETCEAIVKYGLRSLVCSIDGTTQDIYQMYRQGGELKKALTAIEKINHYKEKYKSKFPILHWQFIIFDHNKHQLKEAKQLAKKLNMPFKPIFPIEQDSTQKDETKDLKTPDYNMEKNYKYYAMMLCPLMWHNPQINWDGKVLGCTANKKYSFGNILDTSLSEVLNSKEMIDTREALTHLKNDNKNIPCTTCPIYKEMQKNNFKIKSSVIYFNAIRQTVINILINYVPEKILIPLFSYLFTRKI